MPSLPLACLQVIYTSSRSDEAFLEALRKPSFPDASESPHEVWHFQLKHVGFLADVEGTEPLHLTRLHKGLGSGTECTSRYLEFRMLQKAQVRQYQSQAL